MRSGRRLTGQVSHVLPHVCRSFGLVLKTDLPQYGIAIEAEVDIDTLADRLRQEVVRQRSTPTLVHVGARARTPKPIRRRFSIVCA